MIRTKIASLLTSRPVRRARGWKIVGIAALAFVAGLAAAQPANDYFTSAWVISGYAGSTNDDNTASTLETCETNQVYCNDTSALTYVTNSVWYKWTAPASGTLEVDTLGSAFDTLLSVWTSSSGSPTMCDGTLTNLISDDSTGFTVFSDFADTSYLTLPVTAGQTYYFAVNSVDDGTFDGSYLGGNYGPYNLDWNLTITPTVPSGTFQFTTNSYTVSSNEGNGPQDGNLSPSLRGARITVTRTGGANGRVQVPILTDYTTNMFMVTTTYIGTNASLPNSVLILSTNGPAAQTNILIFDDYQMSASLLLKAVDYTPVNLPASPSVTNTDPIFTNITYVIFTNTTVTPTHTLDTPVLDALESRDLIPPALGALTNETINVVSPGAVGGIAVLNLERSTFRVNKTAGTATFHVLRTGNTTTSVYVNYTINKVLGGIRSGFAGNNAPGNTFALEAGSDYAVDGTDFTSVSGTLTFVAGDTDQAFTVPILASTNVEFNLDFQLALYITADVSADPAIVGGINKATVTILTDNNTAGLQPAGAVDRTWNKDNTDGYDSSPPYLKYPGTKGGVSDTGNGNGGNVLAAVEQPDGNVILAGSFNSYDSNPYNHIVRVLGNGYQDTTFLVSPNSGADKTIYAMALQPDGKIIIGGDFTSFNGITRYHIARLNSDGSLDATFNPGTGVNVGGAVYALALQANGQIVMAGNFTSFNGTSIASVARLNSDGSLDTSFNPGTGPNDVVNAVVVDAIGRVIIGGAFDAVNGISYNGVARLSVDGSLDSTFISSIGTYNPDTGFTDPVYALALEGNQILVGGGFAYMELASYNGIVRLNADGSVDSSFNPGTDANNGTFNPQTGNVDSIFAITLQPDGKILIGGDFMNYNQTRRVGLARLFVDGSLDTSFLDTAYNQFAGLINHYHNPGANNATDYPQGNHRNYVTAIAVETTAPNNVIIGGSFLRVGGGSVNHSGLYNMPTNSGIFANGRMDIHPRSNVARLIGGATPGPGNIQLIPNHYDASVGYEFTADKSAGTLYVNLNRTNGSLGVISATCQPVYGAAGPGIATTNDFTGGGTPTWPTLYSISPNRSWMSAPATTGNSQFYDSTYGTATPNPDLSFTISNNATISGNLNASIALTAPSGTSFKLGGEAIPLGAALGYQSQSPLTIIDSNFKPGVLSFSSSLYYTNQGKLAVITVVRTNGTDGTVQVNYLATNGTAINHTNFNAVSGTLTFNPGISSQTFSIQTASGTSTSQDKTVNLYLSGASGGATIGQASAVLTLVNNIFTAGHLSFTAGNYSVNENAGPALITVNRLGGSSGTLDVTAIVGAPGGTAANGTNYIASTNSLHWNNNDVSARTISVPVIQDFLYTPNLVVNLVLTNGLVNNAPTNKVLTLSTFTNATLTIVNVDFPGTVQFATTNYSVNKSAGFASVPIIRTGGSAQTVTVNYTTQDGTASSPANYIATNGLLTFTNGVIAQYLKVPIIDNGQASGLLALNLALSNATPAIALGSQSNAVLNIIDTDSVNEPAGSADPTYNQYAGFNGNVFALSFQSNHQLIVGGDFTMASGVQRQRLARLNSDGTLDTTFLSISTNTGANAQIRALTIQSDGRIVVGGYFSNFNSTAQSRIARLSYDGSLDSTFNAGSGADNPVYALAQSPVDSKVLVGGAFAKLNGVTFNGIGRLNSDGSADTGFNAGGLGAGSVGGGSFVVYAVAVQTDGKIIIGGDFTTYNGVTVNHLARLNTDGSLDSSFTTKTGTSASGTVRAIALQLDGKILIGGAFTNFNGTAYNRIARLNTDGSLDGTFNPSVGADDTVSAIALQGTGNILLGGQFTHCSGVTRNRITRLNQDGSVDPTINFGTGANDFIAALAIQPDTIVGYPDSVIDEKIMIGGGFTQYNGAAHAHLARLFGGSMTGSGAFEFSSANYQVDERGTNAVITVMRTGGTDGTNISVTATAVDGTAVSGVNYTNLSPFTLNFPIGEVLKTITIPVRDDGVVTPNLTVFLSLTNPVAPAQIGNQPSAVLTIINDDATISFSSATYTVPKNVVNGVAPITVVRNGGNTGTASASFSTTFGGTATPVTDYTPVSQTVNFAAGVSNVVVNIPITNNGIPEGNQTVTMQLTGITGAAPIAPTNATLTIVDTVNAPGQLSFTATNYNVTEGGGVGYSTANVTIQRTFGSSGTVSVNYSTLDGTAVAGIKYMPTNGVLTFADGEVSKTFAVNIVNTTTAEGPQYFNVLLSNPTGGASLFAPTNATVTIINTNTGLAFVLATNSFTEPSGINLGTVAVNVIRLNNTNGTTTVNYTTADGTALQGTNYFGVTNGVLTFNPGDSVKSILITNRHDTRVTGDLFFTVTLSNPSIDAQLTTPSVTTVIDHDADAGISFFTAAQSVYRNSGSVLIFVINSNTNVGPMSVNYTTGGGSAVPSLDYTTTSGTLTFTNGQFFNYFSVPVLVNNQVQTNRTFNVTLSAPTAPGQLVAPSVETVTIIGTNTPPGLSFATPVEISGDSGTTNVDNSASVPEVGDPSIAGFAAVAPVWFAWTAPADGEVSVDTIGSVGTNGVKLDTVLAVFTGGSLGTLSQVAANDDLYPNNPLTQLNYTGQNIYNTNATVTTNGILGYYFTNVPPYIVIIPNVITNNFGTYHSVSSQYYEPFSGPSGLRFNAKAGTTYYFAADTKVSEIFNQSTFQFTITGTGPIQFNWAYHASGVFRFASEDVDQTGITDTNGNAMLLYHCAESEGGFASSHRVIGPVGAAEIRTTTDSYYDPDVNGMLVTVTRVAGSSGRVLVDYTTTDGDTNLIRQGDAPAVAGVDYSPVSGTLIFDDYEMSKTIVVPIYDGGNLSAQPNRDFMVQLSNPRLDAAESATVSTPRVDNIFGKAVCRILDCDIDPRGPTTSQVITSNTVVVLGVTNTTFTTNITTTLMPTNGVFNFSKANYRVPRDIKDFFPNTQVTVYVNRSGTNRASVTVHYRFDNYFLENVGADNENNQFPLQAGSDYATPTPAISGAILGTNSDFNGSDGTLTFPGGNNNPFKSQPIHFDVANNHLTEFNKDIRIGIYELDKDNNPQQDGMVAETTVTILFDDTTPPAGSVDELWNPDFYVDMALLTNTVASSVVNPGTDPYSEVYALTLNSSNQTVIGGSFASYADGNNTYVVNGLARLKSDGSLDTTFSTGVGVNVQNGEFIRTLALTPANEVFIGGKFTSYRGVQRNSIALVNSTGALDTSFNPGSGFNGTVWSVLLQSDGSILAGGDFTAYNGTACNYVVRLLPSGALDTSFNASNILSGPVYAMAQAPSVLLNINSTSTGTSAENDNPISLGSVTSGTLTVNYDMAAVPDQMRIYYGDTNVTAGSGVLLYDTGYVSGTGTIVLPFGPVGGLTTNLLTIVMNQGGNTNGGGSVWAYTGSISVPQSSSGVVVGGKFKVKGQNYSNIARLNSSGALDTSFNPGFGPDAEVMSLAWQLNNQIVAGGNFKTVNGNAYSRIVRFNGDGSLDTAFYSGTGTDGTIYSILPQLNGTLYLGGAFTTYNGTHRLGLARIFADGTLDTSFLDTAYNQFAGLPRILFKDAPGTVYSAAVQGDGNVMIGGAFQQVGGGQADKFCRDVLEQERGLAPSFSDPNLWVSEADTAVEPKSRDGVRNRSNVARLIGGATPGPGNIGMVSTSYAVNKTQVSEPITLVRTNGSLGYASANFAVVSGLAQSGVDYSYSSVAPLYPIDWEYSGPTRMHSDGLFGQAGLMQDIYGEVWKYGVTGPAAVNITINNNGQSSGNLLAGLQMANPVGADQFYLGGQNIPLGVALGISSAPFTIVDNGHQDGVFSFTSASYTATNSSPAVSLIRSNSTIGTVAVSYRSVTNGSTAILGTDYQAASGSLTFSPGQSVSAFNMTVLQNSYISATEKSVNLQLYNIQDSSGGSAFLGLSNAVLRIINPNYQGILDLSTNYYSANLSAKTISFVVNRLVGSKGTLTVQYATTNGTAVNGLDYLGSTNTLVWNSGDISPRIVSIPLVPNTVVGAPDKQFGVNLFNPTLNGTNTPAALGAVASAVMNIVDDNSNGTFQFATSGYLVNENGGYATITVTRTGSGLGAASVHYATADATAVAGTNYVVTSNVLNFVQGQISRSFNVPILNDGKTNPPPAGFYFTVALSNPSAGAVLGSPVNIPVRILDAQSYNQQPGALDAAFNENAGMDNNVLALALQSDGQIVAGGNFTLVNNASRSRVARLNLDGTLDTGFLNGLSGANASVNALVSQTDDRLLIGGAFTTVNGTVRNRLARLMTDGSLDTSFSPGAGADNSVFALAETFLNGSRELYVGGAFSTYNGNSYPGLVRLFNNGAVDSAFAPGVGANGTVYAVAVYPTNSIYNAGQLLVGGGFTNYNNQVVGNFVRLNGDGTVDTNFVQNLGTAANAAVRAIAIQLDGSILIGGDFTNVNGTAVSHIARLNPDGSLDATFTANLAGGINGSVSAIALQADNRIVVGGQFTQANGVTRNNLTRLLSTGAVDPTINFGSGANGSVNAVVVQPADEMLVIGGAFTQYNGQTRDYIARIYGGSVTGSGTFQFTSANYQIPENGGFAIITVTRTGGTSGTNITVNFNATNGTAVAGVNYSPVSQTLAFPVGEVFETVFVPVMDDQVITTNLTVNLALSNPASPAGLGDQANALLTIVNVDSAVSFLAANFTAPKNGVNGVATIDVVRQGTTSGTCTVNFSTSTNGTAVAGVDFYPTNALVTFNPGETDKTIQIQVINNNIPEGNRTVGLQLTNVIGALMTSPSNATLTIIDTVYAPGQLTFSATNYTANSTDPYAYLTVLRTNGSSGSVSVNYTLIPGTAAAGSNYVNNPGTVTLVDGQSSAIIAVQLINNLTVFQTTALSVMLSNPSGGASLINPTNATVTIASGNSGVAFLSATNYVSETNAVGLVFVQRFGLTNSVIHVNYATTNNGTAVAGVNYSATAGTLTFNSGEMVKAVSVPLVNNHITTNLSFGLNLSAPGVGTTLVSPSNAVVFIQGSAAGLSFVTNAVSVMKNSNSVVIAVICSNPGVEPVVLNTNTVPLSVNFYTTNGTAIAGTDYSTVSGTLVFTNGIATNYIVVPIINNGILQGNRTFNVLLTQPTSPGVLASPTIETVTIIDINSGVKFSNPIYSVLKTGQTATINVLRTGYTNSVVTVNYQTTNGTAQAGQQYQSASGTLTFTNGQTAQSFAVTIYDNTAIQPDLTVLLQLSSPTNAGLIYPNFSTLTIHDTSGSLVVPAGAVLVNEGFSPANGIIDPAETNTVAFGFRASAGVDVTNLVATLLATNGVTFTNGAASVSSAFGLLSVGGHSVSRPYTFVANGTNGQNIVATFSLMNGSSNLGLAAFTFTLGSWKTTVSNTAAIIINDFAAATPYPSIINVSGLVGTVIKSTVTLTNLTHNAPGQINALVVAPNQSDTLIMSGAGAGNAVSHVTLTFDDAAANMLTQFGQIVTSTNKPSPYKSHPSFP